MHSQRSRQQIVVVVQEHTPGVWTLDLAFIFFPDRMLLVAKCCATDIKTISFTVLNEIPRFYNLFRLEMRFTPKKLILNVWMTRTCIWANHMLNVECC